MFGLTTKEASTINAAAPALHKPEATAAPAFIAARRSTQGDLSEYAAIAAEVGVTSPHLVAERFLAVLERLQYPIYNREAVVRYMDEKAAKDGTGYGWEWRPVREKDHGKWLRWGRPSSDGDEFGMRRMQADGTIAPASITPASDYYASPDHAEMRMFRTSSPHTYDKPIPLHALKRIAGIEREHKEPVLFMVSDYSTQPHIKPDPFLLAVLPNVPREIGQFVIDFWDEPGFGIDNMLAAP